MKFYFAKESEIESEEDLLLEEKIGSKYSQSLYLTCEVQDEGFLILRKNIYNTLSPNNLEEINQSNSEIKQRFSNLRLIAKELNAKVRIISDKRDRDLQVTIFKLYLPISYVVS